MDSMEGHEVERRMSDRRNGGERRIMPDRRSSYDPAPVYEEMRSRAESRLEERRVSERRQSTG